MIPDLLSRRLILIGPGLVFAGLAAPAGARSVFQDSSRHSGHQKTIQVADFLTDEAFGGPFTSAGMTRILSQALVRDGRFLVVEPGDPTTTAPNAIIQGAVRRFRIVGGGGLHSIANPPGKQTNERTQGAVIELAFRLIETATGQVISGFGVEGRISPVTSEKGLVGSPGDLYPGSEDFRAGRFRQAVEDAMERVVFQIAIGMLRIA